ncbi:hypothetical protein M1D34_31830 (plasmid) [Ensifer sp. D2-11]
MAAVLINDPQTEARIRRLAEVKQTTITSTVNEVVTAELTRLGETIETRPILKDKALEADLGMRMRDVTRDYVRFRESQTGRKGGSRVYQMLARRGAVETMRRIMVNETEGFGFLREHERLDLAFEELAIKPKYASILGPQIVEIARDRLEKANAVIAEQKKK